MLNCSSCGYECDCMDLYYDHLIFDSRCREMARTDAANKRATQASRRMSRSTDRRRDSAGTVRKQPSAPALEHPKHALAYSLAGY
ncbi:hypothetical protein H4R19_002125 [Coemansia spiralis]|nr:hypothetical protein H4R19_002125 [Coemansia spiralis]